MDGILLVASYPDSLVETVSDTVERLGHIGFPIFSKASAPSRNCFAIVFRPARVRPRPLARSNASVPAVEAAALKASSRNSRGDGEAEVETDMAVNGDAVSILLISIIP